MPFFRYSRLHSHFCSIATPCGLRSPAQVAATEETLHMKFERKFARQWRLMNSPVFGVLSWVLALFVPQRKGFGKFRQRSEGDPQAAKQVDAIDSNEALHFSKAIDCSQDLPREEPETPPNVDLQDGLASASFIFGGVWAIESIEKTSEVMLDSWQCFELQLPGQLGRTRHLAGSNARHWHGQVSSAIVAMDPATRKCTTKSGRVYELGTRNGLTGNGEYIWYQWLRINQPTVIVDITDEIKKMLARPA